MIDAQITCPQLLKTADLTAMLRALTINDPIDRHLDIVIAADLRGLDRALVCRVLREYGFEPNDIYSIRFRPHEITIVVWATDAEGKKIKGPDNEAQRFVVHIPIEQEGSKPREFRIDKP